MVSDGSFVSRVFPLIESAARSTSRRVGKVVLDTHLLYMTYVTERDRLLREADKVERGVSEMSEEDFERYLLSFGVWVSTDDDV